MSRKQPRRRNAFEKPDVPLEPSDALPEILSSRESASSPDVSSSKRDRSWDAKRSKATYDLPPSLIQRIRDIADELGESGASVKVSDVARLLLEAGVTQYESGELDVTPRPTGFTLFD